VKFSLPANPTLSPVRRAAAFFAFLGWLTLSSCGEDPDSPSAIMAEQARVFREMATTLNKAAESDEPEAVAEELTRRGNELKELKIRLSAVDDLKEEGREELLQHRDYGEALAAWEKARNDFIRSGKLTPELQRAFMAHHNPAPMPGEGSPD